MIDIRQIHIGSHVSVDGKRVRVCGITRRKIGYHATGKPGEHLRYAKVNEVEPIPLTPELLTELGFHKRFYGDTFSQWKNCDGVSLLLSDGWNAVYLGDLGFAKPIKHLHEAEAFLALHGVELIKD